MTPDRPDYVFVGQADQLPALRFDEPIKCLVVLDAELSAERRDQISDWLIGGGCRFLMAWGIDCEAFHDAFDFALLTRHEYDIPDDKFVMTTWHDDETLESAMWFCQFTATFTYDEQELTRTLLVQVGVHDQRDEVLALYKQAETLADREED